MNWLETASAYTPARHRWADTRGHSPRLPRRLHHVNNYDLFTRKYSNWPRVQVAVILAAPVGTVKERIREALIWLRLAMTSDD